MLFVCVFELTNPLRVLIVIIWLMSGWKDAWIKSAASVWHNGLAVTPPAGHTELVQVDKPKILNSSYRWTSHVQSYLNCILSATQRTYYLQRRNALMRRSRDLCKTENPKRHVVNTQTHFNSSKTKKSLTFRSMYISEHANLFDFSYFGRILSFLML